jgi:hypothetical protein
MNSRVIEDMLWETSYIDGYPQHVPIIYLPTHSPELNPIELIFHILAMRIRSYGYQTAGPCDNAMLHRAAEVMNEMSYTST